jgi:two-component system response regulator FixJ
MSQEEQTIDTQTPAPPPVVRVRRNGVGQEGVRRKRGKGMTNSKKNVFVLDDDDGEVQAIKAVLEAERFSCRTFTSPVQCLEDLLKSNCDVLVSDLVMPEMDGLLVLVEARKIRPRLPVVVITGHGNIAVAVTAMKQGATNFIEKPFDRTALLDSINSAMGEADREWAAAHVELSKREKVILKHIIQGNGNKHIAMMIGKSVRTVEDQRSSVMRKLGVVNVVDLIKRCIALGLA